MSLLEVRNLRIEYPSRHGVMAAVKDLSFTIEKGEILGVSGNPARVSRPLVMR